MVSNRIFSTNTSLPLFPARSVPDIVIRYATPSTKFGGSEKIKSNFSPPDFSSLFSIFVWGDNIFTYGPVEFLNIVDGGKAIFGQVLFLPISLYIIFSNSQNSNYISDTK